MKQLKLQSQASKQETGLIEDCHWAGFLLVSAASRWRIHPVWASEELLDSGPGLAVRGSPAPNLRIVGLVDEMLELSLLLA